MAAPASGPPPRLITEQAPDRDVPTTTSSHQVEDPSTAETLSIEGSLLPSYYAPEEETVPSPQPVHYGSGARTATNQQYAVTLPPIPEHPAARSSSFIHGDIEVYNVVPPNFVPSAKRQGRYAILWKVLGIMGTGAALILIRVIAGLFILVSFSLFLAAIGGVLFGIVMAFKSGCIYHACCCCFKF